MKPRLTHPEPAETEIQHAAYTLWEAAGRPAGRDLEFWLGARERLRHTVHVPAGPPHLPSAAATPARSAQPPGPQHR